ncbi:MAG: PIN domain-containing protein [Myxococcaceae bacterium]
MDANVLIDLCEADRTVIRLISDHVGQVHVPLPILREEVRDIEEAEYGDLGIVPVDPPLALATSAAVRRAGLSFYDHLCLLLAQENGWTCVTNDGRLRRECTTEKVPVLWGLETVALLVEDGALTPLSAQEIAKAIQRSNPRYITEAVMNRFLQRIGISNKKAPRKRRSDEP